MHVSVAATIIGLSQPKRESRTDDPRHNNNRDSPLDQFTFL